MTARDAESPARPRFAAIPVVALAAVKVAGTMAFAGGYGWHRDELYYLACSRHLSLGYVDFPALTSLLAGLDQAFFPGSVVGLRLLPALAGAAVVVTAAAIARELGGATAAQVLAAFAVLISPLYIGSNHLFETVSFDQVVWALLCWLLVLPAQAAAASTVLKTRKDFADEFGWPELARQVQGVYRALPDGEGGSAMILAQNYGEAGALDLYGPSLSLPQVVSPHLTYYYWAPPRMAPETVIAVGYSEDELRPLFADVQPAGTVGNSYGVRNDEFGRPIYVCRRPRRPLWQEWPGLKRLD